MNDVITGILYCHNHNIVHRDIKAENILFASKDLTSPCKIIDFGISLKFSKDSKLQDKTGTILYVAPEVLKGSYDEKCDIWACGVLLYLILCGYPPFYGNSRQSVMKKILKENHSFENSVWNNISDSAKDLISAMLIKDPELRPSAAEVLKHKWF
jgi:calcium-dependent protein kinase